MTAQRFWFRAVYPDGVVEGSGKLYRESGLAQIRKEPGRSSRFHSGDILAILSALMGADGQVGKATPAAIVDGAQDIYTAGTENPRALRDHLMAQGYWFLGKEGFLVVLPFYPDTPDDLFQIVIWTEEDKDQ